MKRSIIFWVVLFHFITVNLFAQEIKSNGYEDTFLIQKNIKDATSSSTKYYPAFSIKNNMLLFDAPFILQNKESCIESGVHYTAFFCKMETGIRRHFNIWLKIRAGNDDIYRQLISE